MRFSRLMAVLVVVAALLAVDKGLAKFGGGYWEPGLPPASSISFVNHGGLLQNISTTSFALTTPASLASGNVLIAELTCLQNASAANVFSPPAGWTQIGSTYTFSFANGFFIDLALYQYVVVGGETATYTFTNAHACNGGGGGDIIQLSGGGGTYSFATSAQVNCNSTTTCTTFSVPSVGETFKIGEMALYFGNTGVLVNSTSPTLTMVDNTAAYDFLGYISPTAQTGSQGITLASASYVAAAGFTVR